MLRLRWRLFLTSWPLSAIASLEAIWRENHVPLLPRHGEGLPLAALEAIMLRRPVTAACAGGDREAGGGVTGFIAGGAAVYSFGATLARAWQARHDWERTRERSQAAAMEMAKGGPARRLLDLWLGAARAAGNAR